MAFRPAAALNGGVPTRWFPERSSTSSDGRFAKRLSGMAPLNLFLAKFSTWMFVHELKSGIFPSTPLPLMSYTLNRSAHSAIHEAPSREPACTHWHHTCSFFLNEGKGIEIFACTYLFTAHIYYIPVNLLSFKVTKLSSLKPLVQASPRSGMGPVNWL